MLLVKAPCVIGYLYHLVLDHHVYRLSFSIFGWLSALVDVHNTYFVATTCTVNDRIRQT